MGNNEREYLCYSMLCDVFIDNAYSSLQLNSYLRNVNDEKDRAYITKLFYGVLEKNVQFDYVIRKLAGKKPKTSIGLLIKIGLYRLKYMSTPSYAAINETVELTKRVGKSGVSGFVNAILHKCDKFDMPREGELPEATYLSVTYSVPVWIAEKLIDQYGYEFTKDFLSFKPDPRTHIRFNSRVTTKEEFEEKLKKYDYSKSKLGYYVTHNMVADLKRSTFTAQSLSSMIATNCYLPNNTTAPVVLDLCGAPGGKSIYLEELCPSANIHCCDLYPHRVDLIKKYANRMKSKIIPIINDATTISPEWVNKCDIVICDVPCSGLGVYKNKPDILYNKNPADIDKIKSVQADILDSAKNYVKVGGVLDYSTCTILREENEDNIEEFLSKNKNFVLDKIDTPLVAENDGIIKLFPNINDGCDGFFIARLRRIS